MMKKILVMCLIGCMMLTSVACGNTNEESVQGQDVVTPSVDNESNIVTELSMEALENAEETLADEFVYYTYEGEVKITGYEGDSEIVVIPDELDGCPVVEISKMAFRNNETIKAVKVGNNIQIICEAAFGNCTSLEYVIMGENVGTIEDHVFVGCTNLVEIRLNEGLLVIDEMAIPGTKLPMLIPRSVTEIGAFGISSPVQVYAGSTAETYVLDYIEGSGDTEFVYEVIE